MTEEIKELDTPEAVAAKWVLVAVMGGEERKIDWTNGMTVRDALDITDVALQRGAIVQVNGDRAGLDDALEPNSVVQITTRVQNG